MLTNKQLKATRVLATPTNGQQLTAYDLVQSYQYGQSEDIPTQASQSGKVLTTNGTALSWGAVTGTGDFVKSASPTFTGTVTLPTTIAVGTPTIKSGTATPEGAVTSTVGSLFIRTDGGASTCLYVKESGTGNTGWKAVTTS